MIKILAIIGLASVFVFAILPIFKIFAFSIMYTVFQILTTKTFFSCFKKRPLKVIYAVLILWPLKGILECFEGYYSTECNGYRWTPIFKIERIEP